MNEKKLLVVDDDKSYLNALKKILTKMGYAAEVAAGSEEALKILEKEKFPLIITTENLEKSGFDGYLSKPAKIEVLKQAIEGAFDKLEENK